MVRRRMPPSVTVTVLGDGTRGKPRPTPDGLASRPVGRGTTPLSTSFAPAGAVLTRPQDYDDPPTPPGKIQQGLQAAGIDRVPPIVRDLNSEKERLERARSRLAEQKRITSEQARRIQVASVNPRRASTRGAPTAPPGEEVVHIQPVSVEGHAAGATEAVDSPVQNVVIQIGDEEDPYLRRLSRLHDQGIVSDEEMSAVARRRSTVVGAGAALPMTKLSHMLTRGSINKETFDEMVRRKSVTAPPPSTTPAVEPEVKPPGPRRSEAGSLPSVNESAAAADGTVPAVEAVQPSRRLMRMSLSGDAEGIHALLKAGQADVDSREDEHGWTALHYSALSGDESSSRLLIGFGAFVDATSDDGATALHVAAGQGHADLCRVLVDLGADPMATNKSGQTPGQVAIRGNSETHSKTAYYLNGVVAARGGKPAELRAAPAGIARGPVANHVSQQAARPVAAAPAKPPSPPKVQEVVTPEDDSSPALAPAPVDSVSAAGTNSHNTRAGGRTATRRQARGAAAASNRSTTTARAAPRTATQATTSRPAARPATARQTRPAAPVRTAPATARPSTAAPRTRPTRTGPTRATSSTTSRGGAHRPRSARGGRAATASAAQPAAPASPGGVHGWTTDEGDVSDPPVPIVADVAISEDQADTDVPVPGPSTPQLEPARPARRSDIDHTGDAVTTSSRIAPPEDTVDSVDEDGGDADVDEDDEQEVLDACPRRPGVTLNVFHHRAAIVSDAREMKLAVEGSAGKDRAGYEATNTVVFDRVPSGLDMTSATFRVASREGLLFNVHGSEARGHAASSFKQVISTMDGAQVTISSGKGEDPVTGTIVGHDERSILVKVEGGSSPSGSHSGLFEGDSIRSFAWEAFISGQSTMRIVSTANCSRDNLDSIADFSSRVLCHYTCNNPSGRGGPTREQTALLEMSYEIENIRWNHSYRCIIDEGSSTSDQLLDFYGSLSITNVTGFQFDQAALVLDTWGQSHGGYGSAYRGYSKYSKKKCMPSSYGKRKKKGSAGGGKEVYPLGLSEDFSLKCGSNHLQLIHAVRVPSTRTYIYEAVPNATTFTNRDPWVEKSTGTVQGTSAVKVIQSFDFDSSGVHCISSALPAGSVHVLKRTQRDGEMVIHPVVDVTLGHTPLDDEVVLSLPDADKLTGERKREDFKLVVNKEKNQVVSRTITESFSVKIKNSDPDSKYSVVIKETIPRWKNWALVASPMNVPYEITGPQQLEFVLTLPPASERRVVYTVEYSLPPN